MSKKPRTYIEVVPSTECGFFYPFKNVHMIDRTKSIAANMGKELEEFDLDDAEEWDEEDIDD